MDSPVDFRLLGPVEVLHDGARAPLGGPQQRRLLALLLLDPGRPVPADRLVEELWPDRDGGAASTLPSYVSRLRASLPETAAITGTAAGYALDVPPESVDAVRFERLVDQGRAALKGRRMRRAGELLRGALTLWNGRPFGDLADAGALQAAAERLEGLRLLALEDRIEADLAIGGGEDLVVELEALVREHPFQERLWGQLMLALYRSQRQADALDAYQRARAVLDEELGLAPSPELERLQLAILRQDVPLTAPAPGLRHLPASASMFIGRETEVADVARLLDESRLVTLTGVGGVGKTRLALEAASSSLLDFPDGAVFVDLSGIGDSLLVDRAVALALDLDEPPRANVLERVEARLRDASLLLVLDNCEHVRAASAALVDDLLASCPDVRILATSRVILGATGEVAYAVPPMVLPASGADSDAMRASEAVQLFMARARAARPRLMEDERAIASAARICADLEGLPLAIELAAARTTVLSLDEIASRLDDRFRFLVSWRRLTTARHRTLRETMDWSFELLAPEEQELLAGLSVFVGPFTLEAVADVCLSGDADRALALIERLVGASLVVADERDARMWYRLLETVREYAAERLGPEATDATRRAHAAYFLKLAERADLTAIRRTARERLDLVIAAQDNLRSALAWAVETGAVAYGLELAVSLERFWVTHDPAEGIRWFSALLERPEATELPPQLRAAALRAYGGALDISGRASEAEAFWRESLVILERLGDEHGQSLMLHRLAIAALKRGDPGEARGRVNASLAIHERTGNRWGTAQAVGTLGAILRDEADLEAAARLLRQSADIAHELGSAWWEAGMHAELASIALHRGDVGEGERLARQALVSAREMGDRAGSIFGVGLLARVFAERGHADRARRLLAAVEREELGAPLGGWPRHRPVHASRIRELLGEGAASEAPGERLSLDAAVALALEQAHEVATAGAAPRGKHRARPIADPRS